MQQFDRKMISILVGCTLLGVALGGMICSFIGNSRDYGNHRERGSMRQQEGSNYGRGMGRPMQGEQSPVQVQVQASTSPQN